MHLFAIRHRLLYSFIHSQGSVAYLADILIWLVTSVKQRQNPFPITPHTQIMVDRWRPRARISVLLCRQTQPEFSTVLSDSRG